MLMAGTFQTQHNSISFEKKKKKSYSIHLGYRLNTANYCLKNQRKISPKVSVTKTIQTFISANA